MHAEVRQLVIDTFLRGNSGFPLDADTDLVRAGICDSLGLMELALALEGRVPGLRIDDQDVTTANFGSVKRIASFLEGRGIDLTARG